MIIEENNNTNDVESQELESVSETTTSESNDTTMVKSKNMKIAIISRSNLNDRVYWSGAIQTIYSKLNSNKNLQIIKIDKLNNSFRKLFALKREYLKYTKKVKFDDAYNEFVSKNFAEQIEKKLNKFNNIDFLLCFDSSLVAYLKVNIPIILWTDLLYSDYYDHYFKN